MILKIAPVHQGGVSCGEDIIYMVANWLNREYEITFSNSWFFKFYPEDDPMSGLLGNRIGIENYKIDLLRQYCGISLASKNEENVIKTFDTVKQELAKERPVVIYLKTFWCPWHHDYQKLSHDHFCLVIGIDSSENLLCLDHISNEIQLLSKNNFMNGSGPYFIFNIEEPPQIANYHDILVGSVKQTINNDTFDNIQKFINHFRKDFNFDLEFQNMKTSIWDVFLYRNIGYIAGCRRDYARFLEFISKKLGFNEPFPQIQEFYLLSSKWNTSRSILVKSYYTVFDQIARTKVINLFEEIIEKEEKLASSLLEMHFEKTFITTNPVRNSAGNLLSLVNRKYTYLDLTSFFNNNAFGSIESPNCFADLTGTGYYFLAKDVPSGIISLPDGMSFLFPEVKDGMNDNIVCEKQIINITGKYNSIMFLGCAEYGNYIENVTIEYEDNELVPITIKFTDWAYEPTFGETIAWNGSVVEKKNDKATVLQLKNRIYAKEYQLSKNGVIKNIILPNCLCIHIFAMTLCQSHTGGRSKKP